MGPGDVLRASGETGVCLRIRWSDDLIIFLRILFLKDSERAGEEGSFGEGVPLEEYPGLSRGWLRSLLLNRLKKEGLLWIFPLPLDRCLKILPTRCPIVGARFRLSVRMLVWSRAMVLTVIDMFFLLASRVTICTCWRPAIDSPLMWVTSWLLRRPASQAGPFLSTVCREEEEEW